LLASARVHVNIEISAQTASREHTNKDCKNELSGQESFDENALYYGRALAQGGLDVERCRKDAEYKGRSCDCAYDLGDEEAEGS